MPEQTSNNPLQSRGTPEQQQEKLRPVPQLQNPITVNQTARQAAGNNVSFLQSLIESLGPLGQILRDMFNGRSVGSEQLASLNVPRVALQRVHKILDEQGRRAAPTGPRLTRRGQGGSGRLDNVLQPIQTPIPPIIQPPGPEPGIIQPLPITPAPIEPPRPRPAPTPTPVPTPTPAPGTGPRESIEVLQGSDKVIFQGSLWYRDPANPTKWRTGNEDVVLAGTLHGHEAMEKNVQSRNAVRIQRGAEVQRVDKAMQDRTMLNMTAFGEDDREWMCKEQAFRFEKLEMRTERASVTVNDDATSFNLNHMFAQWRTPVNLGNGIVLGPTMGQEVTDPVRHLTFTRTQYGINVRANEGALPTSPNTPHTFTLWGKTISIDVRNFPNPYSFPGNVQVGNQSPLLTRPPHIPVYAEINGTRQQLRRDVEGPVRVRNPNGGEIEFSGRNGNLWMNGIQRGPVNIFLGNTITNVVQVQDRVERATPPATPSTPSAVVRPTPGPTTAPSTPEWITPRVVTMNPAEYEQSVRANDFSFVLEAGRMRILRKDREGEHARGWIDIADQSSIPNHALVRAGSVAYFNSSFADSISSPVPEITNVTDKNNRRWAFRRFRNDATARWGLVR